MSLSLTEPGPDAVSVAPVESGTQPTRARLVLRRFLRSRKAVCGLAAIVLLFLLASAVLAANLVGDGLRDALTNTPPREDTGS